MTEHFRQTVTELWVHAGLGAPQFAPDGSASLIFDDVELLLCLSPNELDVLVSADLGVLSTALQADAGRIQKILGTGFALLATHDVLVSLSDDRLMASACHPLADQSIAQLSERMSDVVSAAQTLARLMDGAAAPRLAEISGGFASPSDMIIIQP